VATKQAAVCKMRERPLLFNKGILRAIAKCRSEYHRQESQRN
jgi:hypothetical protein